MTSMVVSCILLLMSLIGMYDAGKIAAQDNECKKYCFASCDKYFGGTEFGPCVHAGIYCSCPSGSLISQDFWSYIIPISGIIMVFFIFCGGLFGRYYLYERYMSRRRLIISITRHTSVTGCVNPESPQQTQWDNAPEDLPPPYDQTLKN